MDDRAVDDESDEDGDERLTGLVRGAQHTGRGDAPPLTRDHAPQDLPPALPCVVVHSVPAFRLTRP